MDAESGARQVHKSKQIPDQAHKVKRNAAKYISAYKIEILCKSSTRSGWEKQLGKLKQVSL